MEKKCSKCKYWEREGDPEEGMCKYNPPVPYMGDKGHALSLFDGVWPFTTEYDWCWKFKQ